MAEKIKSDELSFVIPCFNEEATIGAVLDELARSFPEAELLVVDDGSSDSTAARAAAGPCVRLLRHEQNGGYGTAIRTGCLAATRSYVVWFDADGQHLADMVGGLVAKMPENDCVIGCRTGMNAAPWIRRAGVATIGWLARLLTMRAIPDVNCGLRVFRRELLMRYLDLLPQGFSASATTTLALLECGHRVAWAPVERLSRAGNSRLRVVRDGVRTLWLVVRLVTLFNPWKVFGPLGILTISVAALVGWKCAVIASGVTLVGGAMAWVRSRIARRRFFGSNRS